MLALGFYGKSQERDSIFLFNGQVLIGDIKNGNLGIIKIDDKDLKILSIKAYKIKHVTTGPHLFRIETTDKHVIYSPLRKTDKPGQVAVVDGSSVVILNLTDIALLSPVQKNFFKRLTGNFGLGFSFSKSSGIGQLNSNANVYYTYRRTQYQLTANMLASIDTSSFSRDNENIQLFGSFDLKMPWFLAGQLLYQRNLQLSISRRFQEMLGAGNKLVLKNNWQVWAVSGISLGQERSTEGTDAVTLEMPYMFRINFFEYRKFNMQLGIYQTFFVSLSQWGRVRYDGSINYSHELIHNFYVNLNLYSNYDNRPPDPNSGKFDYGISLSVNYKF